MPHRSCLILITTVPRLALLGAVASLALLSGDQIDVVEGEAADAAADLGAGQAVGQGQQIASVGCTGHRVGDHVPFEVPVGGAPTDPMGSL